MERFVYYVRVEGGWFGRYSGGFVSPYRSHAQEFTDQMEAKKVAQFVGGEVKVFKKWGFA
ncbi:hypothetical protein [Bacillus swezeyi]|uniref:Uncharacterized protein n=1 Tax=Bacillus swezeyi TaxID=1925020 RepID=A0A5M8RHY2_9BACI|nr:hypothetical protein [Bacillus swezeyi]KAA6446673.1 hypothetical protein DX927_23550 [Bacillus swezeyi]TYS32344.1 hypothetical protein FZC77_22165 [Bacillus swezeyi]